MTGLIVDNFAGGGGASLGIELALGRSPDIAVNHDREAIAMHEANHPSTRHLCESVWDVDPVEACAGRSVDLAWFSPDCTYFSKARGAKPLRLKEKKVRALAWVVVRWAKAVRPRVICVENVEEFQGWGPVAEDGRPCPLRRGFTFRRWKSSLEKVGYRVELRELRACDYGAPTTRKRLFVIARCDGKPIVWPSQTHGPGRKHPFRTAAECIDWRLRCPSIFLSADEAKVYGVRRPLAEPTLRRIARGLQKFVIDSVTPFIVPITHAGDSRVHSIGDPLRTITANRRGEHALVAPTLVQTGWGERQGQAPRALDLHAPLGTVMAGGAKHALVAAFLAKHYGGNETPGTPMQLPLSTITTQDHHHLVASSLVKLRGTSRDGQATGEPLHTISAQGTHFAEVRAFLMKYYGTGREQSAELPLGTVTTKDRFGLVTVGLEEYAIVDIGMRMLSPRELFRAQGFPDSYVIDLEVDGKRLTKTAQVRMCGNSVSPMVAQAIVAANVANEEAFLRGEQMNLALGATA